MQEWSGEKEITGGVVIGEHSFLSIKPGTIIKFNKKDGERPPFILVKKGGMIMAEGTESEKIQFTSDQENSNFSIVFQGENNGWGYSGYFRYVQISKAGGIHEFGQELPLQSFLPFISTVLAQENATISENRYPIFHQGGILRFENCEFFDNRNVDIFSDKQIVNLEEYLNNENHLLSIVNSNFENNTTRTAIVVDFECASESNTDCEKVLNIKNNWYGKSTGPYWIRTSWEYYQEHQASYENWFFGMRVVGRITTIDGFRKKSLVADPVIIVPGLMGSSREMIGNDLVLDPIMHIYDDLIESLKKNGYEEGINLFTFPYDWRVSNVATAEKLAEKITQLQEELSVFRFDLVAHSMGGLVVRQYLQSSQYAGNVDQLIMLGTPHQGSPRSYLYWEAGKGFIGWKEQFLKYHFLKTQFLN
jgi:hypothetical protein